MARLARLARVGKAEGCRTARFARHVAGLTRPLLDPPLVSFRVVYLTLPLLPFLPPLPSSPSSSSSPSSPSSPCSPCSACVRAHCCGDPSGLPVTLASTTISTSERRYSVSVLVAAEPPPAGTNTTVNGVADGVSVPSGYLRFSVFRCFSLIRCIHVLSASATSASLPPSEYCSMRVSFRPSFPPARGHGPLSGQ